MVSTLRPPTIVTAMLAVDPMFANILSSLEATPYISCFEFAMTALLFDGRKKSDPTPLAIIAITTTRQDELGASMG